MNDINSLYFISIHKSTAICKYCGHDHILTCGQYTELWECLDRLRMLLLKIYYKSDSYPSTHEIIPNELKNIERLLGQISGYPDCCCDAYVNGKSGRDMDKRIDCNYVMCDNCEYELIKEWTEKDTRC